MNDYKNYRTDVFRFAYGTAKMAQPYLRTFHIKRGLSFGTSLLRKARSIDQLEIATEQFRKIYRDIVEMEYYERLRRHQEPGSK